MKDTWRCPHCRRSHRKTYTYGAVKGQYGNMVARETRHPDATCECGAKFSGNEILGGAYDDPPLEISALVRTVCAASLNFVFWGGVSYYFLEAPASIGIGLGAFALVWLLYFTGQVEAYRSK